jgi:hypothetical protein
MTSHCCQLRYFERKSGNWIPQAQLDFRLENLIEVNHMHRRDDSAFHRRLIVVVLVVVEVVVVDVVDVVDVVAWSDRDRCIQSRQQTRDEATEKKEGDG